MSRAALDAEQSHAKKKKEKQKHQKKPIIFINTK